MGGQLAIRVGDGLPPRYMPLKQLLTVDRSSRAKMKYTRRLTFERESTEPPGKGYKKTVFL